MSDSIPSFSDARQLEDIKFNQFVIAATAQSRTEIAASERNLAARGLAQSGMRVRAELDIIFASIEGVVDNVIACRQELGARVPALLDTGNLNTLQEKLERYIDAGLNGLRQSLRERARGAVSGALVPEAENRAYAAKARLKGKLAALALEARLGMHKASETKVTTIHISNNTIANLNLGNVVGDLNSSIQQLTTTGRAELAEEIRKMTDAIGSSPEVGDDVRKDMLEHLSVVSEESAKPPEQRKLGPLKSSLVALKSGIGVAAQLFGIYQGLEHALKAAGIIPN